MTILIKETVFKVPLFGRSLRMAGHVPVVAGSGRAALDEGIRLLRAGRTVMIFPEGDISPNGEFKKPHTGVARLALATGAPVIPVGISLDYQKVRLALSKIDGVMEPSSWYLRGPYAMTVGRPVVFTGQLEDHEHVRSVSGQVMQHIAALSRRGQLRLAARHAGIRGAFRPARLSTATPKTAFQVAWKGTRQGFAGSLKFIMQTPAFRLAESALVFLMMFSRHIPH